MFESNEGFDFSAEEKQTEFRNGPVPGGSIVIVKMDLLAPESDCQDPKDPLVKVGESGLRMLYAELIVTDGSYKGVSWREHFVLPAGMQTQALTEKNQTACRIGGAKLKAILEAARKPLSISSLRVFAGVSFPVKVGINPRPGTNKSGEEFYRNRIAQVIIPDMPEYQQVKQARELINENGPVTAKERLVPVKSPNMPPAYESPSDGINWANTREKADQVDDVPF